MDGVRVKIMTWGQGQRNTASDPSNVYINIKCTSKMWHKTRYVAVCCNQRVHEKNRRRTTPRSYDMRRKKSQSDAPHHAGAANPFDEQ